MSRSLRDRRACGRLRGTLAGFALLLLGTIAPGPGWAQTLPPVLASGDLLLVDLNNARILWTRPSTGSAQEF